MNISNLLRRFTRALVAKDEFSARDVCARHAWDGCNNNLAHLYRQLTQRGRDLGLRPSRTPQTAESARAVVHCTVTHASGEPVSQLMLLCDDIPSQLVGWTTSHALASRFVSGLIPADFDIRHLQRDDQALASARRLADDLALAHAGDGQSQSRLQHTVAGLGSATDVLGYLQMRIGAGAHLEIERSLRLLTLARVAIQGHLIHPRASESREEIWLYAEDGDDSQLVWRSHSPRFDVDCLLA